MSIGFQKEDWENDSNYSDVQVGKVIKNGDDRYVFFSAKGEDYNGSAYDKNMVLYHDVRENGVVIQWNLEVTEFSIDSETDMIVDEIAQCYGIKLDDLAVSGEWAKEDADSHYRYASDPDEDNRNVNRSEVMTMAGFKEAVYYAIEYDELDYEGEEYHSQADVYCYIRLEDKYLLGCDIKLSSEDYDDATNILLKELETAYGIDLSRYYYEKED